jgi:hypothetical protein
MVQMPLFVFSIVIWLVAFSAAFGALTLKDWLRSKRSDEKRA